MKRIEVKLSLPVVAPLLDVIRQLADGLGQRLAAPQDLGDIDQEFRDAWVGDLLDGQSKDVKALLALFDDEFFAEGIVAFDEDNAEPIVRACAAVRLRLREVYLKGLDDDALEGGVEVVAVDHGEAAGFLPGPFFAKRNLLVGYGENL
jgi:hypothetical protein